MKSRRVPPPAQVLAPPPWLGRERQVPFEPESAQEARPCRRCGRSDRKLEAQLNSTRAAMSALEQLMDWLAEENRKANRAREHFERAFLLSEQETTSLRGLMGELDLLARAKMRAFARARRVIERTRAAARGARAALAQARQETEQAREEGLKHRRRASRLARALRDANQVREQERAALVHKPSPGTDPGVESRVRELTEALEQERALTERYARYVDALESRMKQLAEERSSRAPSRAKAVASSR